MKYSTYEQMILEISNFNNIKIPEFDNNLITEYGIAIGSYYSNSKISSSKEIFDECIEYSKEKKFLSVSSYKKDLEIISIEDIYLADAYCNKKPKSFDSNWAADYIALIKFPTTTKKRFQLLKKQFLKPNHLLLNMFAYKNDNIEDLIHNRKGVYYLSQIFIKDKKFNFDIKNWKYDTDIEQLYKSTLIKQPKSIGSFMGF